MNAYMNYRAETAAPHHLPRFLAAMAFVLRQMHVALKRGAEAIRLRRMARDFECLDDRLLKDVGLRREHLPSGATRIVSHCHHLTETGENS